MPPATSEPLLLTLKAATWNRHRRFDRIPFVAALVKGRLPMASYVTQLRALAIVVGTLERSLQACPDPVVAQVRPLLGSRFALLCEDLNHLPSRSIPANLPALKSALALAQLIQAAAPSEPVRLLGFLYVLEGTIWGNHVHLPDLQRCFALPDGGRGVGFYRGYGEGTADHWQAFTGVLNAAAPGLDTLAMLEAAEQLYEGLEELYELLHPLRAATSPLGAADLNPEAGDHRVPGEPELLLAAVRAAEGCWTEFPYFQARYGARGLRFAESDGAWLASLVERSPADAIDQVLWLGRILAVRGMPRLLLERQLTLLIEELGQVRLPRKVSCDSLKAAARALGEERRRALPEERFEALRGTLAALPAGSGPRTLDLPTLLAAALADERAGLPEGCGPLLTWAEQQGLLQPGARQGLEAVLAQARLEATGPG